MQCERIAQRITEKDAVLSISDPASSLRRFHDAFRESGATANLRPKYLMGPPLLRGAVLLLQYEPESSYSMVGAMAGGSVVRQDSLLQSLCPLGRIGRRAFLCWWGVGEGEATGSSVGVGGWRPGTPASQLYRALSWPAQQPTGQGQVC